MRLVIIDVELLMYNSTWDAETVSWLDVPYYRPHVQRFLCELTSMSGIAIAFVGSKLHGNPEKGFVSGDLESTRQPFGRMWFPSMLEFSTGDVWEAERIEQTCPNPSVVWKYTRQNGHLQNVCYFFGDDHFCNEGGRTVFFPAGIFEQVRRNDGGYDGFITCDRFRRGRPKDEHTTLVSHFRRGDEWGTWEESDDELLRLLKYVQGTQYHFESRDDADLLFGCCVEFDRMLVCGLADLLDAQKADFGADVLFGAGRRSLWVAYHAGGLAASADLDGRSLRQLAESSCADARLFGSQAGHGSILLVLGHLWRDWYGSFLCVEDVLEHVGGWKEVCIVQPRRPTLDSPHPHSDWYGRFQLLDGFGPAIQEWLQRVPVSDDIYILRFGGAPRPAPFPAESTVASFERVLSHGPPLEECRAGMRRSGFAFVTASQAMIFVAPCDYGRVVQALEGETLHPFHVVVAASFVEPLFESLREIPARRRLKEKLKDRKTLLRQGQ